MTIGSPVGVVTTYDFHNGVSQSGVTAHQNATRAGIGGYQYAAVNWALTARRWSLFQVRAI